MITVVIQGGLGNQMFQFAAAYALARTRGVDLQLDISSYARHSPHQGFELDRLFSIAPHARISATDFARRGRLGAYLERCLRGPRYTEPDFFAVQDLSILPMSVILDGFWQSERYFSAHADAIRALYQFVPAPQLDERLQVYTDRPLVSLHVRRGDYYSAHSAALHGVPLQAYYAQAIAFFRGWLHHPRFMIFSDDLNFAASTFQGEDFVIVDWNREQDSYRDMYLMARCEGHILANSTFSWWGAWLNKRVDKRVIAPRRWFAKDPQPQHLIPESWVLI